MALGASGNVEVVPIGQCLLRASDCAGGRRRHRMSGSSNFQGRRCPFRCPGLAHASRAVGWGGCHGGDEARQTSRCRWVVLLPLPAPSRTQAAAVNSDMALDQGPRR